jgi:hypothetical protein
MACSGTALLFTIGYTFELLDNYEFVSMQKEAIETLLKTLFQHITGGAQETHSKRQSE